MSESNFSGEDDLPPVSKKDRVPMTNGSYIGQVSCGNILNYFPQGDVSVRVGCGLTDRTTSFTRPTVGGDLVSPPIRGTRHLLDVWTTIRKRGRPIREKTRIQRTLQRISQDFILSVRVRVRFLTYIQRVRFDMEPLLLLCISLSRAPHVPHDTNLQT